MDRPTALSATSDLFKTSIQIVIDSVVASETLELEAHVLVKTMASDPVYSRPLYGNSPFKRLKLYLILHSMLEYARPCGRDAGLRYTASAIRACQGDRTVEHEETMMQLQELAIYWFTHFLFFFKANTIDRKNLRGGRYDPTLLLHDDSRTRQLLLMRDGNRCSMTKRTIEKLLQDIPDLIRTQEHNRVLHKANIIPHAFIEVCGAEGRKYPSAEATFDILRQYADLPYDTVDEFAAQLDHPSNGMILTYVPFYLFDTYDWSLKATNVPHAYELEKIRSPPGKEPPKYIHFEDHSADYRANVSVDSEDSDESETSSTTWPSNVRVRLPPRGIPLPNPHFIRIHSALAHVLHQSGAGQLIETAVEGAANWFEDEDGVLCGDDWQLLMLKDELRQSNMRKQWTSGSPRKRV